MRALARALAFLVAWALPSSLPAQDEGWNAPRALELIRDARHLRQSTAVDPNFRSYSSQARGHVYFFLDREDTGERILVKTDQIAIEVYWSAPGQTRQRIVGLRDGKSLPTNIRYHLDHLVVVQDEFGDRIRIGDGDEVESVLHPVAPGSETVYDFLLADSVSLILQGVADTVRVYEIRVRPRDFSAPGFVGSVFLDRATRAIVRMAFTFTPASYVDRYLDHIRISLENGLWMGKHWLPYRQELEIRRELPYLDIPAGSVIRGWFDIRDYEINPPLPAPLLLGPTITALPEELRRAFPFEEDIHAHLESEGLAGLGTPPTMEEIRAMAVEIARERYLSGLGRLRLFLPRPVVSSVVRYNRAEGLFLGAGFSYGLAPPLGLTVHGGFSFGRERPALSATIFGGERHPDSRLVAFWNHPLDLGPVSAVDGVLNSLSTLLLHDDFRDLHFATGLRAAHAWVPHQGWMAEMEGRWEEHDPARDVVSPSSGSASFRAIIPTEEGVWASLSAGARFPTPWSPVRGGARLTAGRFQDRGFGALEGVGTFRILQIGPGWDFRGEGHVGVLVGEAPLQTHYFLGGRETVPGHPFRSQAGSRYWLLRGETSHALLPPWARLRFFGAMGRAWGGDLGSLLPEVQAGSSTLFSVGMGLGLGWDVVRLDLARGLGGGGEWEIILAVNRDFWAWL